MNVFPKSHKKMRGNNHGCTKSFDKIQSEFCSRCVSIGAGALNQAVKAVAIARGFVAPHGMDLVCVPAFIDINIDGEERTAIKLLVEPR